MGSYNSSSKISVLLKPTPFITLFFLSIIMLSSRDIKKNSGSILFPFKSVQESYHQNNPKSLASVCYANIKQVCFYSSFGYTNEYLRFDDLPSTFSMGDKVLDLQKSEILSGYPGYVRKNWVHVLQIALAV